MTQEEIRKGIRAAVLRDHIDSGEIGYEDGMITGSSLAEIRRQKADFISLREFLEAEAEAGNYVIAGGDMNQIFSSVDDPFAARVGTWRPGVLDVSEFSEGWQFAMDTSAPSCRSLDRPLEGADPEDFTFYLIDGFIVSKELAVTSLETQSLGFRNSDHNPVLLEVRLPVLF